MAHLGVDVEVVEEDELGGEGVGVRGHLLAEEGQVRVAVALRQVAEHLVVGPVLADDVEDVLDRRGLAGRARDGRALGPAPSGRRPPALVALSE